MCHQDLQFVPDKAEAVREMRRVRLPGGDGKALAALLSENGFQQAKAETISHDVTNIYNGPLFARMNAMAVVGMSSKGKALDDAGRGQLAAEIAAASTEVLKRYAKDGTLTFALTTNVATARV